MPCDRVAAEAAAEPKGLTFDDAHPRVNKFVCKNEIPPDRPAYPVEPYVRPPVIKQPVEKPVLKKQPDDIIFPMWMF